jgi:alpha-tubulin suppressor-like RCC1 family protein
MKCSHLSERAPISRKRAKFISAACLLGAAFGATAPNARADALYSFGLNQYGQLGDGLSGTQTSPQANSTGTPQLVNVLDNQVVAIGTGAAQGLAADNGALYGFGLGLYGELGNNLTYSGPPNTYYNVSSPSPVPAMVLTSGVTAIVGTNYESAALANGAVYTFGSPGNGALGNGSSNVSANVPTLTANPVLNSGVSAIAAGSFHELAIKNGAAYVWGFNGYGQSGLGYNASDTYVTVPTLIPTLASGVTSIAAGDKHSLAVKNGVAYAWGYNQYGQLANNGNTGDSGGPAIYSTPAPVIGLPVGQPVSSVSGGGNDSYALVTGKAYAWGRNDYSELGNGSYTSSSGFNQSPGAVSKITGFVVQLVGGTNSGYALTSDGTLWGWGAQTYGQLGNNNVLNYPAFSPVVIALPANASAGSVYTSVQSSEDSAEALVTVGAAPSSWAVDSSGLWNDSTSWTSGVPNSVDAAVTFTAPPITATRTILTTTPVTVGNLSFTSASSYIIQGTGSIQIQANLNSSVRGAAINDYVGNHTVAPATLEFATNTNLFVSYGSTLTLGSPTGSVLIDSNTSVSETNYGTVAFTSTVSLNSGASLNLNSPTSINALTLGSNAITTIVPHGYYSDNLLQTGSLSLSSTSTLDVTNNEAIVHNGNITSITASLAQGDNGGQWNGSGIASSTAASDTSHLTAIGSLLAASAMTAGGQSLQAGDVLVRYTYYGDATLDGKVDGSDYSRIDNGYLLHLTGWNNGDFNYDGVVNGSDYTLIDNAFNTQGAAISTAIASPSAIVTSEIAPFAGTVAVPEPTTLCLLSFGACKLVSRRRRKIKERVF